MTRPLALTVGEPAGIGPDITVAAWMRRAELDLPPFYLLADPGFIARRASALGLDVPVAVISPGQASPGVRDLLAGGRSRARHDRAGRRAGRVQRTGRHRRD